MESPTVMLSGFFVLKCAGEIFGILWIGDNTDQVSIRVANADEMRVAGQIADGIIVVVLRILL